MFILHAQHSHQHQKEQNSLHFHSKTPLETIVSTSTIVFIISKLVKGVTNNLIIVMLKFAMITLATLKLVFKSKLDLLLIQLQKHLASKM